MASEGSVNDVSVGTQKVVTFTPEVKKVGQFTLVITCNVAINEEIFYLGLFEQIYSGNT